MYTVYCNKNHKDDSDSDSENSAKKSPTDEKLSENIVGKDSSKDNIKYYMDTSIKTICRTSLCSVDKNMPKCIIDKKS